MWNESRVRADLREDHIAVTLKVPKLRPDETAIVETGAEGRTATRSAGVPRTTSTPSHILR